MAISKKKQLENHMLRLLDLEPGITIDKSELTPSGEIIHISLPVPDERTCTCCGSSQCIIKGSGSYQNFLHFPINNRRINLRIFKRRLLCKGCGASFYENPDWCIPRLPVSYPVILSDIFMTDMVRNLLKGVCLPNYFGLTSRMT